METQQPIDTHDTHLLDALVGSYVLVQTNRYQNSKILARLVDFDYGFLMFETPRAHKKFLLSRSRVAELEPLTDEEAMARLKPESQLIVYE